MVAEERLSQGDSNVRAATAGNLQGCEGVFGVYAEGEDVTHCIKGGVSEVRQRGLFLCNPDGESGVQRFRYWIVKPCLVKFDVSDREHGHRNRVGHLHEGRKV